MDNNTQYETVAVFDRVLGGLDGVPGVDKTKATTLVALVDVVGKASTFIVQTYRNREGRRTERGSSSAILEQAGDVIFLQHIDDKGSYRIVIPPTVADTIARQREALTAKGRTRGARTAAETRRERGGVVGFAAMSPEARRRARAKAKATRAAKAAKRAARLAAKGGAK